MDLKILKILNQILNKDGITVLIGNNGSGKSNILEAISAIFSSLYKHKTLDTRQWDFSYRIECNINQEIIIEYNKDNNFSIIGSYGLDLSNDSDISHLLPNTCYMIYNGEDQRIKENIIILFIKIQGNLEDQKIKKMNYCQK